MLDGFSLHAGVHIHANDHEGREKLPCYILRPPLALHRLSKTKKPEPEKRYRLPWAELLHEISPSTCSTARSAPAG